jgi:probable O-glycosylation ligase (exosortase A-associated)
MGLFSPYILGLGYVWVDMFNPQRVVYSWLGSIPISFFIGAATLVAYLLLDRKNPPRFNMAFICLVLFAGWVTLSLQWAVSPEAAESKWNWAFKVICFTVFVPYLFRTRIQIEALILTILFSIGATILSFGLKTAISGGGYGLFLGLYNSNYGLGEGSTLALTAVSAIPLFLFFANNSLIIPRSIYRKLLMYGFSAAAVLAAIGTTSRTGLVALFVLMFLKWVGSSRKFVHLIGLLLLAGATTFVVDESWRSRMSTITDYEQESSAAGRIAVWKWTIEFVMENPLGGGFESFRINKIRTPHPLDPDQILEVRGKAFHNSYFEVLGEHGFVGLALFGIIILLTFRYLRRLMKDPLAGEEGIWISGLASTVKLSLVIYLVGSLFIGIAFQPFMYYLIAAAICLRELAWRDHQSAVKADTDSIETWQSPGQLDRWGRNRSHPSLDK